ncbi:ankyrin repeat protein [Tupanvirus deep ocean]|uniref:Ankyrin repeat protein n=2 Tax=Tupanvirus TaxID=2094720 RepID=A0AC62A7C3_9VIRU|nr:ankyrin repeat protein [Tupanvirus deep ocean]QKU33667.1 ankyrin repeat protein [Tupanvirus deep ocean]
MSQINPLDDASVLFDRNDGLPHDQESHQSQQLKDLRKIINEFPMTEFPQEIAEARRRVANKLIDIASIQNDINSLKSESFVDNTDVIDKDMFMVGTINNNLLTINIPPITVTINLAQAIRNAMLYKKPKVIRLMIELDIDIFKIEPRVMIMCVETEQDELLRELISKKIPIYTQEFRCLYQLAAQGKLDLIKEIMKNYRFPSIPEIVSKICIQAIQNNHVAILKYFIPPQSFHGAPDQMFCFFINSIQYGGHLDVIKFFIENGISIRQDNYKAVHQALKFERAQIIKYFHEIDHSVDQILTEEQKQKYMLDKIILVKQYIGIGKSCNINYDDINVDDHYYQCESKIHHYKEEAWSQWCKIKSNWICPCCFAPVKRILYVNNLTELID